MFYKRVPYSLRRLFNSNQDTHRNANLTNLNTKR